jgi:hypothetical protein
MSNDENKFRKLLNIPHPHTTEAKFKSKVELLISGFPNVELGACEVYDDGEVCIFIAINHDQEIVAPGLPKQTLITTDLFEITVSCLLNENEPEITDVETLEFSWKTLKDIVLTYQPQTY